jgi:hypothetical protein
MNIREFLYIHSAELSHLPELERLKRGAKTYEYVLGDILGIAGKTLKEKLQNLPEDFDEGVALTLRTINSTRDAILRAVSPKANVMDVHHAIQLANAWATEVIEHANEDRQAELSTSTGGATRASLRNADLGKRAGRVFDGLMQSLRSAVTVGKSDNARSRAIPHSSWLTVSEMPH